MTEGEDARERLLAAIREHSGMDDAQIIEAGQHGADTGWPEFCYYADTDRFYQANEEAIYELLNEECEAMGHSNVEQMISQFQRADMLSSAAGRRQLLAWFALEEIGRWLEIYANEGESTE